MAPALRPGPGARSRGLPAARGRRSAAGHVGRGGAAAHGGHHRLPRRAQPPRAGQRCLLAAHGARRPAARRDAAPRHRLLPRQRVAARADPAAPGHRSAVRVRLPRPARAGRPGRHRLHRSPCLDGGVRARRGLGRPGPDVGPAGRRGAHPAGVRVAHRGGRADLRDRRGRRARALHLRQLGAAAARGPARHGALRRRDVGARGRARPGRRRRPSRGRRAPHDGRRADVRGDRGLRRAGVERRRRRADEARARRAPHARAGGGLRTGRGAHARSGQVVSRRAAATLADRRALAHRRRAGVGGSRAPRRSHGPGHGVPVRRRGARRRADRAAGPAPRHGARRLRGPDRDGVERGSRAGRGPAAPVRGRPR